jgi:nickel superoxide dismutase
MDSFDHQARPGPRIGNRHDLAGTDPASRAYEQPVAGLEGGRHALAGHPDPPEGANQPDRSSGDNADRGQPFDHPRGRGRPMGRVKPLTNQDQGASLMTIVARLLSFADRWSDPRPIYAHCDLPCGVYDPAQARIEAESVKGCMERFNSSEDDVFKTRAVTIKEQRAELVKHHLWVLWSDYFKPDHLEAYPNLHELFWKATKTAGDAKKTNDTAVADDLLAQIAEIDKIFWQTKK